MLTKEYLATLFNANKVLITRLGKVKILVNSIPQIKVYETLYLKGYKVKTETNINDFSFILTLEKI